MAPAGVTFKIVGAGYYEAAELIFYTHLPLSATILDLKKAIASFYSAPVERQILHCIEADDLQDDRTIESYHFDRDNHVNILLIVAKPSAPTPAPVEKSNIQVKEGEKSTDDAKDGKTDDIQGKEGEKNTEAKED